VRDGGEPGAGSDLADQVGQDIGGDRRVRRHGPLGVVRVDSVKAEDGVEVDQPAALELGHLGIRQPDLGAVRLGQLVQLTAQRDDGAPPQLGRMSVPDRGGVVVVAVQTQRPS
jgi:hypothetical protein